MLVVYRTAVRILNESKSAKRIENWCAWNTNRVHTIISIKYKNLNHHEIYLEIQMGISLMRIHVYSAVWQFQKWRSFVSSSKFRHLNLTYTHAHIHSNLNSGSCSIKLSWWKTIWWRRRKYSWSQHLAVKMPRHRYWLHIVNADNLRSLPYNQGSTNV